MDDFSAGSDIYSALVLVPVMWSGGDGGQGGGCGGCVCPSDSG